MGRFTERRWPVRLILIGIMFALVLPSLLISTVLLLQFAVSERAQSRAEAVAASGRAADVLDRELGAMIAALRALATSIPEREVNLPLFERQARQVAESIGQHVILMDPTGQQLVNTRLPPGSVLPRSPVAGTIQRAIDTRQPVLSDLFVGAAARHPIVALYVPVLRDGEVTFVLAMSLEPAYVSDLLVKQALPAGWVASVVDSQAIVFARTQDAERFMGQTATADYREHARGDSAVWTGTTLEGTPVLSASTLLRLAKWRVGVGVPLRVVDGPLRDTLLALALGGILTLALGGGLAWRLARSVQRPLQALAMAGQAVGAGQPMARVQSSIAEVAAVSDALVKATSDLRARADALAAERARLAAIIDTVPVGLMIAQVPSGRIVSGNGRLLQMLRLPQAVGGLEPVAAFGADGQPIGPGQDPLDRVLAGAEAAELQCQVRRADQSLLWVNYAAAPIQGADGVMAGVVIALLDVDETVRAREAKARFAEALEQQVVARTAELGRANQQLRDEIGARAKAEEQLRQSQKMEAVGRLTGGIAHDFNNMLTVIVGSLDLLRRRSIDDRTTRLLDNALEGASRAATLTSRLLAFSRQHPLAPQPLDGNRLVSGMSDLLHRTLGETIRVETVLAAGLWQAMADPNQLENALLNLAVNARDAILETTPSGGRLTIETGNAYLDEQYVAQHEMAAGQYVMIAITDTGTGMRPEVLERVFEPFYTTKPMGQGTGLGLSQVHGFMKQSGGHVAIYTEPGHGTTVKLYLPRAVARTAAEPAPAAAVVLPAMAGGGETVLVVEDEAGVRRFTVEALRELGYVVLEAEAAAPALALLDAHPETALLFTDVVLPEVNGRALAEEARRRRPGLPVLFTTGYTRNAIVHNGQLDADVDLIGKPFTIAAVALKLRDVLSRS